MTERFRRHLQESGLVPEGVKVLLGYSGGADSTCLLHLLREAGADVVAAHLHHGQRPEADHELVQCAEACKKLGVPFVSGRADVPAIAQAMGVGLEEAGRHARYDFFERCRVATGADLVATAHTRDDLVETVVLNLARGTGLHGLAGIPPKRGNLVRPLLPFSRAETRAFCAQRGLWFHDDPANQDESFARVRVRKRVLPELESINPAAQENVSRATAIVEEEDRFLDGLAAAALARAETPLNGPLAFLTQDVEAAFDRAQVANLPRVLLARGLRLATGSLGAALDAAQTRTACAGVSEGSKGAVTVEGGEVVVEWDERRVLVRSLVVDAPYRHPLTVPGETESDDFGWKITAEPAQPGAELPAQSDLCAVLGLGALKGALYFRSYEPGDSIRPLGFKGTKKVGAVLSEMRLTEAAKRRLPVVCDLVGPVWVPGGCVSERARLEGSEQRALRLRFGPL